MTNTHAVVEAYWAAAEAREWDAFGKLLADDVVYQGPQTRTRARPRRLCSVQRRGLSGCVASRSRANRQRRHPGRELDRIHGTEGRQPGLCFFELDDWVSSLASTTSGRTPMSYRQVEPTSSSAIDADSRTTSRMPVGIPSSNFGQRKGRLASFGRLASQENRGGGRATGAIQNDDGGGQPREPSTAASTVGAD